MELTSETAGSSEHDVLVGPGTGRSSRTWRGGRVFGVVAAGALVLGAAACGDDDDDGEAAAGGVDAFCAEVEAMGELDEDEFFVALGSLADEAPDADVRAALAEVGERLDEIDTDDLEELFAVAFDPAVVAAFELFGDYVEEECGFGEEVWDDDGPSETDEVRSAVRSAVEAVEPNAWTDVGMSFGEYSVRIYPADDGAELADPLAACEAAVQASDDILDHDETSVEVTDSSTFGGSTQILAQREPGGTCEEV